MPSKSIKTKRMFPDIEHAQIGLPPAFPTPVLNCITKDGDSFGVRLGSKKAAYILHEVHKIPVEG